MSKSRLFIIVWGVVNGMVQELMMAMMDKVLTGPEVLRIIKAGVLALRFGGISSLDVDQVLLVTSEMEHKALLFKDGDGALYVPKALLEKLRVNLDEI